MPPLSASPPVSSSLPLLSALRAQVAILPLWLSAVALGSGACNVQPLASPDPDTTGYETHTVEISVSRKLDLLVMIDNSPSMENLQKTMARNFPAFIEALRDEKSQELPDLHVGVVSSDMGAGTASAKLSVITQCGRVGGDRGLLQSAPRQSAGCVGPTDPFIIDTVDGDGQRIGNHGAASVADAFSCIATLGQTGCGMESQFGSTLAALENGANPGFLREDAHLAVVMLTNEDDCTIPPDSSLFDPAVRLPGQANPFVRNIWCPQFGWSCDQPITDQAPDKPFTLTHCRSKEDGMLMNVADFVARLKNIKSDTGRTFLAAITTPTVDADGNVNPVTVTTLSQSGQTFPVLGHTCEAFEADAAVRIHEAVKAFDDKGFFAGTICESDYTAPLAAIGKAISTNLKPACSPLKVASRADGSPHCLVADHAGSATGPATDIPFCDNIDHPTGLPCWHLDSAGCPTGTTQIKVERTPSSRPPQVVTKASCEVCVPGSTSPGCL